MLNVSVIIPAFNAGRYVRESIESVLNQTYPPRELIVVDDGSTDQTSAVANCFEPRVRVVRQKNQGVSAARNHGARVAVSEWLAFLDADDWWRPEKLEAQMHLVSKEGTRFAHCGSERVDQDGRFLTHQVDGLSGNIAEGMLLFKGNHANGSTTLVHRGVFEAANGYDTNLSTSADWDMCFRLGRLASLSFAPQPLAFYRQHGTNMHANPALMERDMLRAFQKAFSSADHEVMGLQSQAHAALHLMLSGSFASCGDTRRAIYHGLRAMLWRPSVAGSLFPGLLRTAKRRAS